MVTDVHYKKPDDIAVMQAATRLYSELDYIEDKLKELGVRNLGLAPSSTGITSPGYTPAQANTEKARNEAYKLVEPVKELVKKSLGISATAQNGPTLTAGTTR